MGAEGVDIAEATSERVILPPFPVPCTVERLTPSALAMARTAGEANTFPVFGTGADDGLGGIGLDATGVSTFGGVGEDSFGGACTLGGALPSVSISISGV